jgi:hypothetical protein
MTDSTYPVAYAGCVIDGRHGWHAHYMVIEIAENLGMELDKTDTEAVDAYRKNRDDDAFGYILDQGGLFDRVDEWLNENAAADGYQFGWHEGDFFYMPDEWWSE